ncbi:MAG: hypothetical protein ACTHL8_19175 [Burkholderiaceae bacterium]
MLDNLNPHPGDGPLVKRARAIAKAEFARSDRTSTSNRGAYKVCAVALDVTSDKSLALFSGGLGFKQLLKTPTGGGARKEGDVTSGIKDFLKSSEGGEFTEDQISKIAYAQHGRGAMNCAEPKVWFDLTDSGHSTRNWVLIPFAKPDGELVYSAPCENCRRWVYGQFHFLSKLIAASYGGGAAALAPGRLRSK